METDELAQHLESLQREECYRVDAVLKESPFEVTQRVYFMGANGAERGPYIRKFITSDTGLGLAYQRMYEAQKDGRRFKHLPNILECYSRDGQMVVVMEYVRGATLQDTVYLNDPSIELALNVFPRICDAVSEMHVGFNPPIIHRDLKPSNVILTGSGLVLIDFGISREYHEGAESDTTHFGTREFAPPEQYGFGQTDVRSDVYSLGMVLYFCLTEEIPSAKTREQEFKDARIPEPLRKVIAKATDLDPAKRYQSASDLESDFVRAANHAMKTRRPASKSTAIQNAQSVQGKQGAQREQNANANKATKVSGHKPKTAKLAIAALACVCLFILFASGAFGSKNSTSENVSADSALSDSSQAISAEATSSASASSSSAYQDADALDEPTESELAQDLRQPGEPKNEFDPATNVTVTVGDIDFQVPSYFWAKTSTSEDGASNYYYAETGSSVALLMTSVSDVGDIGSDEDFESLKEDYVRGFVESADVLDEITTSTDYQLAGHIARVMTGKGSVNGIPLTMKFAFFFKPGSPTVGTIAFGQTSNAQFDYSSDFAKVLTSAKPTAS